jgi:hypothetical protein
MIEQAASANAIPEAGFTQPQTALAYDDLIAQAAFPALPTQPAEEAGPVEKIGFWENVQRGGWDGFFNKATFGVKELAESASLYKSATRLQSGRYSTGPIGDKEREKDETKVVAYLEEQAEVSERGKTIPAKVGDIVGEMLPFMAEFIATGGVASLGKAAAKKGILKLVAKTTGKAVAGKVGKVAAGVGGLVTSAAIRTALTPHRTLNDFIQRRMPDIQVTPEGQLIFEEAKDSPYKSAYKAIGNQFIEMFSEESGTALGIIGGKIASKVLPKGAVTAFRKLKDAWVSGGAGRTAKEFAEKMATKAGFNGILEEYSEERLGALMRTVTGIDDGEGTTFEKIQKALWPGAEQAFVELIAFSVPGVARAGAAVAFDKTTYSRKDLQEQGVTEQTSAPERKEKFDADVAIAEEAGTDTVHTMPDGTTMPGPEHAEAVAGSERVVVAPVETEAEAEIVEQPAVQEQETVPEAVETPQVVEPVKKQPSKGKQPKTKLPEVSTKLVDKPKPAKKPSKGKQVDVETEQAVEAEKPKDTERVDIEVDHTDIVTTEDATDTDTVDHFVTKFEAGETVEPITLVESAAGDLVVKDGHHRLAAAKKAGIKKIPAIIKRFTTTQEELDSIEAGAESRRLEDQEFIKRIQDQPLTPEQQADPVEVARDSLEKAQGQSEELFNSTLKGIETSEVIAIVESGDKVSGFLLNQELAVRYNNLTKAEKKGISFQEWKASKRIKPVQKPSKGKQAKKTVEVAETVVDTKKEKITQGELSEKEDKKTAKPAAGKVKSTSKIALQMEKTLADQGLELGIEYDPISIKEQVAKAIAFVGKSVDEAKKIAYGAVNQTDILDNAIRLAYFQKQIEAENFDEAARIANWIRSENTRLGQEIVVNKGFLDDTSVANFTKQLVTAKMEKAGAGLGKAMKKSPIKRVNKRVKKEVLTLKERVAAARKKDFAQAQEIIDSLRCP